MFRNGVIFGPDGVSTDCYGGEPGVSAPVFRHVERRSNPERLHTEPGPQGLGVACSHSTPAAMWCEAVVLEKFKAGSSREPRYDDAPDHAPDRER